eukprot:19859-Rhodomonas_salina.3
MSPLATEEGSALPAAPSALPPPSPPSSCPAHRHTASGCEQQREGGETVAVRATHVPLCGRDKGRVGVGGEGEESGSGGGSGKGGTERKTRMSIWTLLGRQRQREEVSPCGILPARALRQHHASHSTRPGVSAGRSHRVGSRVSAGQRAVPSLSVRARHRTALSRRSKARLTV